MFVQKLWYVFCFSILCTGLSHFYRNQNFSVNFKKSHTKSTFKFAICFRIEDDHLLSDEERREGFVVPSKLLKKFYEELRQTFDKERSAFQADLNENAIFERSAQELNMKFVNSEAKIKSSFREIRSELQNHLNGSISFELLIKANASYLKNDLACYLADHRLLDYLYLLNGLRYRLHAYTSKFSLYTPTMLYDHKWADRSGLRMLKTIVNYCPDHQRNASSFQTLNDCMDSCLLKAGSRTGFRMYLISDDHRVYQNDTKRNLTQEKRCHEGCKYCYIHSYLTVNGFSGQKFQKHAVLVESYRGSIFVFLIQFISLLFLFTNTSVYYLLSKSSKAPVRWLCKLFENRRFAGPLLRHTSWLLLALCVISTVSISSNIVRVYLESLRVPVKSEVANFTFLPELFSIVICVPVQLNLNRKNKLALDENLLEKYSFADIERLTDEDLELVLKRVYLMKQKKEEISLLKSKKVYFKNSHLASLNSSVLTRCFRLEFPKIETVMFRDLLITSDLVLELDPICYHRSNLPMGFYTPERLESLCPVYLMDDFKPFVSTTFQHQSVFQVNRRRIEKTQSFLQKNCTDYAEHVGLNCSYKQICLERCINEEFSKKHGSLSIESRTVLDRDQFERRSLSSIHFTEMRDVDIIAACERRFVLDDCSDSYFERSYRRLNEHTRPVVAINLDFENLEEDEFESSLPKLLIDILNIVILFFGTNINVLLVYVAALISRRLKVGRKWPRLLVVTGCSVGFLAHSVMVYLSIVKAPLVSSGYYDKPELIFYPNLTFCFDYNTSKLDPNFRLTGDYLDRHSKHLTPDRVFARIAFVNQTDHLNDLSFGSFAGEGNSSHLNVLTYFTKTKKCFLLRSGGLTHEEYEFSNRDDPYPLKIFFSEEITKSVQTIGLKSVPENLHKNFEFEISAKQAFGGRKKKKYQIKSEILYIVQVDEFKSVLSILTGGLHDSKAYLRRIAEHFKTTYNIATLELVLKEDLFECEINDELFWEFYEQRKDLFDNSYLEETSRKVFLLTMNYCNANPFEGLSLVVM